MVRAAAARSELFAWGYIQDSLEYDERHDDRRILDGDAISEDDLKESLTAYTFDMIGQQSVNTIDRAGNGRLLNQDLRHYDCTLLSESVSFHQEQR